VPITASAGGPAQEIRLRLGIPVAVDGRFGRLRGQPGPEEAWSVLAVILADASGIERPIPLTNQGGAVYEYSYLAPARTALRVKVSSNEFLLADGSGSPIDERGQVFSAVTPSVTARSPELRADDRDLGLTSG
jgi:hypothetical protein